MAYINDLVFTVKSKEEALRIRLIVAVDLKRLGWVHHLEKGQWEPAQVVKYLGLIVDLREGRWRIPTKKIQSLVNLLEAALGGQQVTAKTLARLLRKILSLQRAIPLAKLYSRETFNAVHNRGVYVCRD